MIGSRFSGDGEAKDSPRNLSKAEEQQAASTSRPNEAFFPSHYHLLPVARPQDLSRPVLHARKCAGLVVDWVAEYSMNFSGEASSVMAEPAPPPHAENEE